MVHSLADRYPGFSWLCARKPGSKPDFSNVHRQYL